MKSPLIILIELLVGLISNISETLSFIFSKLIELFVSLSVMAGLGIVGFLIAVAIGSVVLFFVLKFIFGSSKKLILLALVLILLFVIFVLLLSLTAPPAPTNTTAVA